MIIHIFKVVTLDYYVQYYCTIISWMILLMSSLTNSKQIIYKFNTDINNVNNIMQHQICCNIDRL